MGNVNPFVHPQGWTLSTVYIEEWRAPRGDVKNLTGINIWLTLWTLDTKDTKTKYEFKVN
jgi:hypothetical protein